MEALTAATLQAFHLWLVATPIARPWRGSTVRSSRSIQSRMKDLRAVFAWATEREYLTKAPKVIIPTVPQNAFPGLHRP